MPTITRTIAGFDLDSLERDTYSTRGEKKWVLDLEEIMDGSTINSATLSLYTDTNNSSGTSILWMGAADSSKRITVTNVRSATFDVKSLFDGKTEFTASDAFVFTYQVSVGNPRGSGTGHFHGYPSGNIVLTIVYTLPYSSCTAPTSVTAAATDVAPGASVRVSWSGASAGRNNPIASYTVYRSSDRNNWSVLQTGVTNAYLDVTAPTANGATYYYQVAAIGTVAGYDSSKSTAMASIRCAYSAPSMSSVLLDGGSDNVYKASGTAVLSWTGAAGTNNTIVKYKIRRNGLDLDESTGTSLTVDIPSVGGNYYYTVVPVGQYSTGEGMDSPTLYTFSDPTPPTGISVSKAEAAKSEDVTLSWSGAAAGTLNAITGYRVYRATSATGTYSKLGNDIPSTETGGSVTVKAHATNGSSYYYKVSVIGAHSESAKSDYVRLKTVWTAPTVSGLAVSPVYAAPGVGARLTWQGSSGTNNPLTGFEIYQDSVLLDTVSAGVLAYDITVPDTVGSDAVLGVKPLGTYSDGSLVSVHLYVYGDPEPPVPVIGGGEYHDAGTGAVLSWSGAEAGSYNAITGYRVMVSSNPDAGYAQVGNDLGASVTQLAVTTPSAMGTSRYYRVIAIGAHSVSEMSGYAVLTAQTYSAPSAPTGVAVTPAIAGIDDAPVLSWEAAADGTNNPVTGYRVFRSTVRNGTYTQLGSDLAANVRSLNVAAPGTMGASYYYRVYALAAKAGFTISAASETVQLTAMVYTACGVPQNVRVSASLLNPDDTVTLSWSAGANGNNNPVTGYRVYRNTGSGYALFETLEADVLEVTDTVGASGAVYAYKVVSVGMIPGFDSAESAPASVTSNSPPGPVRNLRDLLPTEYFESGTISLSFSASVDADRNVVKYEVEKRAQSEIGGEFSEWTAYTTIQADPSSTDFVVMYSNTTGVTRGCKIQFRVRAVDSLDLVSAWAETRELIRNQLPLSPAMLFPPLNAVTYNRRPYIVFTVYPDPDAHAQFVDLQVDAGEWVQAAALNKASGTTSVRIANNLSVGVLHIIKVRIRDDLGAVSPSVSFYINIQSIVWAREIRRGVIISRGGTQFNDDDLYFMDAEWNDDNLIVNDAAWADDTLVVSGEGGISHQAEIVQMYGYINTGRAYYGLSPISVPETVGEDYDNAGSGKIGMFADWGSQMRTMYAGLKELAAVRQETLPDLSIPTGMIPTAGVVNAIRTAIENM